MLRPLSTATAGASRRFLTHQIRTKTKSAPRSPTIPVILTQNVPRLGPKGAIVAVTRGTMRNILYPRNQADYYTSPTPPTITERDPDFRPDLPAPASPPPSGSGLLFLNSSSNETTKIRTMPPNLIVEKLEKALPKVLVFERRLMVEGEPEIFGSVGAKDVVEMVRELAPEVPVQEEWVSMEKVKMVGEAECRVMVRGSKVGEIVRGIKVVPAKEA